MPSDSSVQKCLPDFLVIGGMKCASTTLHQDLSKHPGIDCGQKELNALTRGDDSPDGLQSIQKIYQSNFARVQPSRLLGDVSTTYSMLPQHAGVAERARSLIGDRLKVIYVVRNPIRRTISHHQHMMNQANGLSPDINEELKRVPELIGYSCYAKQLLPWVDCFGLEQLLVLKFEDYVSDRKNTVAQVLRFLELDPDDLELDEAGANRTGTARVAGPLISRIYRSGWFQNMVRPLMPSRLRDWMKPLLLKKTQHATIPPSKSTLDRIIEETRDDLESFASLTGWNQPIWDLESTKNEILAKSQTTQS